MPIGLRQVPIACSNLPIEALIVFSHVLLLERFFDTRAQKCVVPQFGQELIDGAFIDGIDHRLQFGVA